MSSNESFVTLATNENYALGALTLGQSLRNVNTNRKLTVLITSQVPEELQNHLRSIYDFVEFVDVLNSNDTVNLELLKRPELGVTFTKLHCWRLTQFSKCVFLDADCLVLQNCDELFDREEFSAATDIGWPDCFNSGVFVFRPSLDTYTQLIRFALDIGSFDGGDQGLLNAFYSNWSTSDSSRRLPFIYNMTTNASYSYAPAYKQFKDRVKVVHFIGAQKPWYFSYNLENNTVVGNVTVHESDHLNQWWQVFSQHVLPSLNSQTRNRLSVQLVGSRDQSNQQSQSYENAQPTQYHEPSETPVYVTGQVVGGVQIGSEDHKSLWERGQIEYTGRDSFSNIQAHLDNQLNRK